MCIMEMLTLKAFEEASEIVTRVTTPTNLVYSKFLSEQIGNDNKVYLKPENMQMTGAYKLRGAYYKISTLTAENQALKFQASQAAQNAFITANQEAQTAELIRRIAPMPVPAYTVPAPYSYGYGTACGGCC